MTSSYIVSNIKARLFSNQPMTVPASLTPHITRHSNFISFHIDHFAFVLFPKSGQVNISGIRGFNDIKEAVRVFNSQFKTNIPVSNIVVDNTTASGKLHHRIKSFATLFKSPLRNEVSISVRPHYFPSALIRPKGQQRGTIILFANGKYIIVGARSAEELNKAYETLCALTSGE